ncbi:MAG: ATP-binding cassette domain-containing protein, partial [Clostridiaceae bacterium]|nr:ATP-binding cassette domain-containing protein [Clostridiaceae bacterium]
MKILAIEVLDLAKRFKDISAVKGISFEVRQGELFGFLGPNGAGKSTTIKMLATLIKPTRGTAKVNGYDIRKQPDRVRESIGLVFQDPSLDEKLTARENLFFHALIYNMNGSIMQNRIAEVLGMVGLAERQNELVKTFSGGMRRRLEIIRGMVHYPRVLFLDEPTVGLDPQTRKRIWEYINYLREKEGLTIFLTTHYMEEAEHCHRIAIIDRGEIVALDTPDNLKRLVGGDVIKLSTGDNREAIQNIEAKLNVEATVHGEEIRVSVNQGEAFIPRLVSALDGKINSITLKKPSLDDVFVHLTGKEIRDENVGDMER